MLKQPVPTVARWMGGIALVLTLAIGVGFTAWSAQPKREVPAAGDVPAGMLMTQVEMSIDAGKPQQFAMVSRAGEPFAMRTEQAGQQWEMHATATPLGNGRVALDTTLSRDGQLMGSPKLVVHEGRKAAIKVGEKNGGSGAFEGITLEMTVTAAAPPVPPVPPAPSTPPAAMAPPAPMASPTPPTVPTPNATPRAPMPVKAPPSLRAAPPVPALPPRATADIAPLAPPPPPRALSELVPPSPPPPPTRLQKHAAPPAPPATPGPVMNAPMTNPPKYPVGLARLGVSGHVVLLVDVSAEGNPTSIEVAESVPAGVFDATAIEAAWKWKFQPVLENGKPAAGRVSVPVEFKASTPRASKPTGTI